MSGLWKSMGAAVARPDALPALAADTVHGLFWSGVSARGDAVMARQKELGVWREWTWREAGVLVQQLALGFEGIGLKPGECVSILANTCVEWAWCDLAVISAGGISNGIYPTDAPDQVHYLCQDSHSVFLVVEDDEQLDKVLEVRDRLPLLRRIVVMDGKGLSAFRDPMVMSLAELMQLGTERLNREPDRIDALRALRGPGDVAILVYTSGTTGRPKGAMHTHRGLLAGIQGALYALPQDEADERICFLPLCHVAERVLGLYAAMASGARMNFVENPATVPANIQEIAPTLVFGVPRIWEKFYSTIEIGVKEAGSIQRALYHWGLSVGHTVTERCLAGQEVPAWLRLKYRLAGWLGLDHIRRYIGIHRCRLLVSAGAPISPDLIRWYMALGIPMLEAWGQTECAGVATCNTVDRLRPGSVGRPAPGTDVRLAPGTDELLVRSPSVFLGYLNQADRTAEAIDAEGWLHTGDVGAVDAQGFIRITDRLKDIIITSGGKNITPSEWENELKFSPYVTDAVIVGDARPYLTAIVMIDQENVEKYAQDNNVQFSSYQSLARSPEIRALIKREVESINTKFARVEQIKNFYLLETQLSPEDEELTPTMKLKRKTIQTKYASQIESMYAQADT